MDLNAPQPRPVLTTTPAVWPLIVTELRAAATPLHETLAVLAEQRDAFGRAKYGTPLQVQNGREPLVDALQEALDAMAYTRQRYERVRTVAAKVLHEAATQRALDVLAEVQEQADALHVFREEGGGDLYAARDIGHALQLWLRDTGMEPDEAGFVQLGDDTFLELRDDDGSITKKTCREWIAEVAGPGAFAGEHY